MPLRGLPRRVACRASGFRRGSALRVSARPARHSRRSNGLAAKTCPPRPRRGSRRGCPARGARRPPGRAAISRIGFAEHRAEGSRDAPRARERSRLQMNAIAVFEERRRELDTLLAELNHVLWQRGIPAAADADGAPCDQQASLCELVERLEREVHTLPARKSVRLLAGIVFRAAQARLQAFATLAGRLSEAERARLAALLRLGEQERRGIATCEAAVRSRHCRRGTRPRRLGPTRFTGPRAGARGAAPRADGRDASGGTRRGSSPGGRAASRRPRPRRAGPRRRS